MDRRTAGARDSGPDCRGRPHSQGLDRGRVPLARSASSAVAFLLGIAQGLPAPGGQHKSAAAAAGKTQALGDMANQVEVEELVFVSRRTAEVPPEPGSRSLHELLTKVPRLGEWHPLDELLQQPA